MNKNIIVLFLFITLTAAGTSVFLNTDKRVNAHIRDDVESPDTPVLNPHIISTNQPSVKEDSNYTPVRSAFQAELFKKAYKEIKDMLEGKGQ